MKKIGIVTGATSGMGKEFLLQIAKKYSMLDEIWAIGRRVEKIEDLEGRLPNIVLRPIMLDLSARDDLGILEEMLEAEEPQVFVLANAAGVGISNRFHQLERKDIQNMVSVNCNALTQITYMTLPYMIQGSHIYQFASSAGFAPQPNFSVYAATKAYVIRLSQAIREELKDQDIGVTIVCPGPVKTEFITKAYKEKSISRMKRLIMVHPSKVVQKALKDGEKNKAMSVYGIPMKVTRVACKALPGSFIAKVMG